MRQASTGRAPGGRPRSRRRPAIGAGLGPPSGIVAIVGRPNVGKSTLFNRLTGERRAIVDELAGLTRDRLYGVCEWAGRSFTVVDTAGLDTSLIRDDPAQALLSEGTQSQARIAIAEADLCLFMVDVRAGIIGPDEQVADILRRGNAPVLLVGNKAEGASPHMAHELYALGLGEPMLISAQQGIDVGDLLDRVVEVLPPVGEGVAPHAEDQLRFAIIGRPNVGKSTLLNALAGEERALVSPVPGTTRDTVDTVIEHRETAIRLIDTAGIRRRGVVGSDVEHYSLLRALRAMERCDVAIVVIDVSDGTVAQDRHIAGYAADASRGLVIIANKWDLLDEETRADPATLKAIASAFDFVPGVPVLTLSATEGRNVNKVLDTAVDVATSRATRIPTGALNSLLRTAIADHPPRIHKGRRLKVFYATQAATPAPTIVLFVNDPEEAHFAYVRYLENRIRAVYAFRGVPIRMVLRERGREEAMPS